ncbi:MAG: hypothetical protein AVDCRST_MAG41-3292 [uncultured Corynebacteriales bacterium]|uniref:HTH marR-type domain-containing protein n=1 Tax=uncultured Mycobacteriales bacterium TaxID=581187 RepID=A0A6J4JDP1_9ACTN|nr:MAG: hypothetical protein AVDCRST_MAG41-3292 [uncultured Corynebacteriales bacterium]
MTAGTGERAVRGPCDLVSSAATADLAWLARQAAGALTAVVDRVCRDAGLADMRDWLVLGLAGDGLPRTQLEIASMLGIDKTTLVSILDRLERDGLVVRRLSPTDRRVRVPETTPAGAALRDRVTADRDAAFAERLAAVPPAEQETFRRVLWSVATGPAC